MGVASCYWAGTGILYSNSTQISSFVRSLHTNCIWTIYWNVRLTLSTAQKSWHWNMERQQQTNILHALCMSELSMPTEQKKQLLKNVKSLKYGAKSVKLIWKGPLLLVCYHGNLLVITSLLQPRSSTCHNFYSLLSLSSPVNPSVVTIATVRNQLASLQDTSQWHNTVWVVMLEHKSLTRQATMLGWIWILKHNLTSASRLMWN